MDTIRFTVAFLIAPLAIPTIEFRLWEAHPLYDQLALCFLYVAMAYAGTFLFGIPTYLFLYRRRWGAFWVAPIAGFVVAGSTWCLLGIVMVLCFGRDLLEDPGYVYWSRRVLWPYGPLGAFSPACCGSGRGWSEQGAGIWRRR